ncbi:DUF6441 family protein [Caldimonas brevitalea]|uniref:Uncharacterized protein n=1 Tax=Caldimonas brevitalea TaxID=413882 RepID=A0A0G3BMK7_9BURK|nr:DUF6441 family protein [Caldimonas brevitalea]AKJ30684.1 hypothetical protein AAW51_3993 [Caldimonas brevitalea]
MNLQFTASGLLDANGFRAWHDSTWRTLRGQVASAMRKVGDQMEDRVRAEMRTSFGSAKPAFLRSMRAKLYNAKMDRFPALHIGSKIPWLGIHEQGGVIQGRMLIPLLPQHRRIGPKAFKRVIRDLLDSGNAYFIKKDGRAILMAENLSANSRTLTRFRRAERERTALKRLPRRHEIPIAVLVRRVTLRRRFDLRHIVARELPRLTASIENDYVKIYVP